MHLDTMEGKTVVITGATSGIGQVAAETLAKMGAPGALLHRRAPRIVCILDSSPRALPTKAVA
jgi:NADP-dependent 3-hydroxy acid dehydrogenase YdfG